jgi:hypothetical protein
MRRFANMQMLLVAAVLLLQSCSDGSPDTATEDGDTIFYPDTVAFRQNWKLQQNVMREDLFTADTFYNQLGLDTFELTYTPCDCPDWIDQSKAELECKECSDFYVDPADVSLNIPENLFVNGNRIIFYGVRIPEMNIPANKKFTTPNPPRWTVIRYYGYKVTQPYKIWGPPMKVFRLPDDTIEIPVTLLMQ